MHRALVDLLRWLAGQGYAFTTVTPETHARVLGRRHRDSARDLRDVFGWSLPFAPALVEPELLDTLHAAGLVDLDRGQMKSRIRVSSLRGRLFAHSAYPTDRAEAVFFGPDSHRFTDFVIADLQGDPIQGPLLDIGAGSGVGAILAADLAGTSRLVLTDINPATCVFALANAEAAGLGIEWVQTGDIRDFDGQFALIIANPPFIDDADHLAYRHGGGHLGAEAALEWTAQALEKLTPGGRFLLYSGSAIVGGRDALKAGLEAIVAHRPFALAYRELDPDIFGEQLSAPAYAEVERIAAAGARIDRL